MALNEFTTDVNNVQGLADQPTESATVVKQTFDKAGGDIKTYLNTDIVPNVYDKSEVDTAIADAEIGGDTQKATQAEAEAGTADDKWMTPLKTVQSINANVDLSTTGKVDQYTPSTSEVVTDHIAYNGQSGKNITLGVGNRFLWKADEDSDTETGTPTLLVDSTSTTDITVKDGGNIIAGNYYESIYDGSTWLTTEMPQSLSVSNLVAEATLTGSSVTISDLDINADGGIWDIYLEDIVASANAEMLMELNGETSSYTSATIQIGTGTTTSPNTAAIAKLSTNSSFSKITLSNLLSIGGTLHRVTATSFSNVLNSADNYIYSWAKTNTTADNITSITFKPSIGSFTLGTVKIYKIR